jgi:hypothetical protein
MVKERRRSYGVRRSYGIFSERKLREKLREQKVPEHMLEAEIQKVKEREVEKIKDVFATNGFPAPFEEDVIKASFVISRKRLGEALRIIRKDLRPLMNKRRNPITVNELKIAAEILKKRDKEVSDAAMDRGKY